MSAAQLESPVFLNTCCDRAKNIKPTRADRDTHMERETKRDTKKETKGRERQRERE